MISMRTFLSTNISVNQFLSDINSKFIQRRGANEYPLYSIEARVFGGYYNNLEPQDNFAIKYIISVLSRDSLAGRLSEYKISFRNGPHGFNVPVYANDAPVPRRAVVIPYSSHINTILDKPPVPPDFRIVPYSGVSNRLLLLLNSSTGEFDATPVLIKESDLESVVIIGL
jgi:hypothetical protein